MRTNCFAKSLLPFAVSFLLALGLTNSFKQISARQTKGFTAEEARSHLNKKVQSLCNAKNVRAEETKGKVEFLNRDDWDGQIKLLIHWENSLRGKHELIYTDKDSFDKCVRIVE